MVSASEERDAEWDLLKCSQQLTVSSTVDDPHVDAALLIVANQRA